MYVQEDITQLSAVHCNHLQINAGGSCGTLTCTVINQTYKCSILLSPTISCLEVPFTLRLPLLHDVDLMSCLSACSGPAIHNTCLISDTKCLE